jgi:hypothetical protein
MNYPLLGLATVLFSWICGIILIMRWPGEASMSLSEHAAAHTSSYRFFVSALLMVSVAFAVFGYAWLIPTFDLSQLFSTMYGLALACQFAIAIVPDKLGWQRMVHRPLAYGMGGLMAILLFMLANTSTVSMSARIICGVVVLFALGCMITYFVAPQWRKKFLYFQSGGLVAFDIAILAIIFWR